MSIYRQQGLSENEVKISRQRFGSNTSKPEKTGRFWQVLKDVVLEPLFIILVGAALIYFLLGAFKEGIVMIVALCFVSGISLYQESKSRNAVNALKKLTSPLCQVIRGGNRNKINSEDLVVDDLIILEDGNIVPADAVVIEAHDCSVNESILTGESLAVEKSVSDLNKQLYQGTILMSGSCIAQVTTIGNQTRLGKIGRKLEEIKVEKTPLQLQIQNFVRSMIGIGAITFLLVWGINYYSSGSILHGLLHGLTLVMSLMPEEIPVAFSTFMALGAFHLYKKKVIARSPHTVETLGAASVICTDKTGTLTENEMQLAAIYDLKGDKFFDLRMAAAAPCEVLEYAMWASEPDPFDRMEKSLHTAYEAAIKPDKRAQFKLVLEYPLSGKPPIMTHVYNNSRDQQIIASKGSLETLLRQSVLKPEQHEKLLLHADELATKGFRVLAVGKGMEHIKQLPPKQEELLFEILGLVAFYDPPKKNSEEILNNFYKAGIQVKMMTGDYAETAIAIARQIKMKVSDLILTGEQVMAMPVEELAKKVNEVTIFARMFPEAKLKVVEVLKLNGEVVAMTGDGVNDGPALKAAHIGIAMGLRGSELAKNAAALILSDDNLEHMVEAVSLGRKIYENLKKAIQYIISIHIPIVLIVTFPLLAFWKFTDFFSPVHVIFLELIMGPTCSIIFENEPIEADSMSRKPRKMSSTFFSFQELILSIIQGVIITIACLGLGYYYMKTGHQEAHIRTIIYTTLIFSNIFLTLVNRSFRYSIFVTMRYKNNLIPLILTVSLLVLFISIYLHPVRNLFQFEELRPAEFLICLSVSFMGVIWIEVLKWIQRFNKLPDSL